MFEITLGHYLILAATIFTIGVVGIFLNRKNIEEIIKQYKEALEKRANKHIIDIIIIII